MFHIFKSNRAFNRTVAHPLDSAVRIALHQDDLAALHFFNKARAVIFKRALPEAVRTEMKTYTPHPRGYPSEIRGPAVYTQARKAARFEVVSKTAPGIAARPALMTDMAHVTDIFRKATGARNLSSPAGLMIAEWFMDMNDPETRKNNFWTTDPHLDGLFRKGKRITCAYSEVTKDMGTGWFPGAFTRPEAREISNEYLSASDPDAVLLKYNHQTTDAGDIFLFNTEKSQQFFHNPLMSLMHNSPVPPVNKTRLCLLLPT